MTRPPLTPEQVAELLDNSDRERPAPVTLEDGTTVVVRKRYDDDHTLYDDGDWYGRIEYADYRDSGSKGQRPSWCDGAARKFHTRDGFVWWQPPEDAKHDPAVMASLAKRVGGYCSEDWTYIGLEVRVTPPPCEHGKLATLTASLWGIESDTPDADLSSIVTDLYGGVS